MARAEPENPVATPEAPVAVELSETAVTDADPTDPDAMNVELQEIAAERSPEEELARPKLPYHWTYEFVDLFKEMSFDYTGERYENQPIHYRLFVPDMNKPDEKFPLIVWLHGYGEGGNNNLRHLIYLDRTIFQEPAERARYRFFLLAVQCPQGNRNWISSSDEADDMVDVVMAVVDQTIHDFPIDESKITVTGLSSGGSGCWEMALRNPDRFAGVAPMAGGGADLSRIDRLVGVPVWAFHNQRDRRTPIDNVRTTVDQLRAAGGNAYLTEINAAGHGGWIAAFRNYDLLEWLLDQERGAQGRQQPGRVLWSRWWNDKKDAGREFYDISYEFVTSLTLREAALQFGIPIVLLVAFLSAWRQRDRRRRARRKTQIKAPATAQTVDDPVPGDAIHEVDAPT